ncbi:hypothetical protein GCM10020218_048000 [Dactylosporangium vinaceum]
MHRPSVTTDTGPERRLRALVDNLPALCAYWDRDLHNVVANGPYLRWFGVTPEQMVGMHIRDVLGEAVYAKNLPYITGVLAGREQLFERTLIDSDGVTHHTQASYVPDVVDGTVAGFFVLVTDVTPRVEAERALAEAQRLAELGSWQLDLRTRGLTWSAEVYQIAGVDAETFEPGVDNYLSLVEPDDRDRLRQAFTAAAEGGLGYDIEYRLRRSDGDVRDIQGRGNPITDGAGTVIGLRGTVQDVTTARRAARELARMNQELAEANQLQADIIGMLGHDLRQPLTSLLCYLDELATGWEDTPDFVKQVDLRRADAAARRVAAMIEDVLVMASIDAGSLPCRPAPTRLADVLAETAEQAADGVPVGIDTDPAVRVLVDPFHLRQILANLIGNAVKYGRPPIGVVAAPQGTVVKVDVYDHGEGVPDDFVPRLFDRFTRATTGIASRKPGTGFGLYIVRQLALANHGTLSYRPHQPHGACFTLSLPAADALAHAEDRPPHQ